jgi:hypothetical protein
VRGSIEVSPVLQMRQGVSTSRSSVRHHLCWPARSNVPGRVAVTVTVAWFRRPAHRFVGAKHCSWDFAWSSSSRMWTLDDAF